VTSSAAKAAAHWWGQVLRREFIVHDNGDGLQSAMMTSLQPPDAHDHDPAGVDRFENLLAEAIDEALERAAPGSVFVGVDYGPDPILADTYAAAGLGRASMFTFPAKTNMTVRPDKVTAAEGYRAPWAEVWSP
jgi:hypothetical protein